MNLLLRHAFVVSAVAVRQFVTSSKQLTEMQLYWNAAQIYWKVSTGGLLTLLRHYTNIYPPIKAAITTKSAQEN